MMTKFVHKKSWCKLGLALVLFLSITLQMPLMSYSMESMDCGTKIMCSACGCVMSPISSPLNSYLTELSPSAEFQGPKPIVVQEPHFHPPR